MSHKIGIKEHKHVNHLTSEFPNSDEEFFTLENFKERTTIEVKSITEEEMIFDLKGIDPSLANALRRILISEIPTMAIENCIFYQNTCIIPDEVLSHRLGLIPIKVDAGLFNYKKDTEELSEFNHLLFKLHVICEKEPMNVYSNELKWIPQGNQKSRINHAKPVHDDILIAKLRPGQEIEVELVVVKGVGKTHAKWSPVCTAYYRLLPSVSLKTTIKGENAERIKSLCPMKVFDVEDSGKLFVKNQSNCSMCRECIRDESNSSDIILEKFKNQYECKLRLMFTNFFFIFYFK